MQKFLYISTLCPIFTFFNSAVLNHMLEPPYILYIHPLCFHAPITTLPRCLCVCGPWVTTDGCDATDWASAVTAHDTGEAAAPPSVSQSLYSRACDGSTLTCTNTSACFLHCQCYAFQLLRLLTQKQTMNTICLRTVTVAQIHY